MREEKGKSRMNDDQGVVVYVTVCKSTNCISRG